jgi:RNA polymerase sigma-70 factor (ECF subfamily)
LSDRSDHFEEVYSEFQPKLYRYFVRLVGEREAEDLTQETMVKVNNALERFRGESSLSTWIYSIATNVARDRYRSAAHRAESLTETGDEEELTVLKEGSASATGSLEHVTVRKEMNT